MNAPARRVLLLASHFPPGPQVILRSLKFAEYLPQFGWEPIVLTGRQPSGASTTVVPRGVSVHRVRQAPTLSSLARKVRRPSVPVPDGTATTQDEPLPALSPTQRLLRQMFLWFDTPDSFVGWLPFALASGVRVVRRERIRVIHASGPPFSVVLSGALLAKASGRPLILDFRDTWTLDPDDPFGTLSGDFRVASPRSRLGLLRILESWCLRQASATLFTSRTSLREYARVYPHLASRMYLIFNGADTLDFAAPVDRFEEFAITHVGTIHDYQAGQLETLLQAFAAARADRSIPAAARIVLVGPIGGALRARLARILADLALTEAVTVEGTAKHSEAIAWMRRSRLLLMFAGTNRFIRLSKMSEYLAAGRPVLAFATSDSETGFEARAHGWFLATENSHESVRSALISAFSRTERSLETVSLAHPHPLNRMTEAQELAALLDRIVAEPVAASKNRFN